MQFCNLFSLGDQSERFIQFTLVAVSPPDTRNFVVLEPFWAGYDSVIGCVCVVLTLSRHSKLIQGDFSNHRLDFADSHVGAPLPNLGVANQAELGADLKSELAKSSL